MFFALSQYFRVFFYATNSMDRRMETGANNAGRIETRQSLQSRKESTERIGNYEKEAFEGTTNDAEESRDCFRESSQGKRVRIKIESAKNNY